MLPVIFSEVNLKNEQGEKPNEQVVETALWLESKHLQDKEAS